MVEMCSCATTNRPVLVLRATDPPVGFGFWHMQQILVQGVLALGGERCSFAEELAHAGAGDPEDRGYVSA